MSYKILAVNLGSTSTKTALFEDDKELFNVNLNLSGIDYNGDDGEGNLQKLKQKIINEVNEYGFKMESIDAYVGRGGNMAASAAGVYEINQKLLETGSMYKKGHVHASTYSPALMNLLSKEYGGKAYVLNSEQTDELQMTARFLGFSELWRRSAMHVLNHKEVGAKAASAAGKSYEEARIIVVHMGGGISVVAHKNGRMVDYSGSAGEGPMSPTRSGTIACLDVIEMAYSGKYTKQEMCSKVSMKGGLFSHLGTADGREIEKRIEEGDEYAKFAYDSMIYQIAKYIGAMAVALSGKVDIIALTGGLANSEYLTDRICREADWIAPVIRFAGEYEMECLSNSVLRVLKGEEKAREYTGKPAFDPESLIKKKMV